MMNYEEMSDFEINGYVAMLRHGFSWIEFMDGYHGSVKCGNGASPGFAIIDVADYCNNPSDAWLIIIENKIRISPIMLMSDDNGEYMCTGEWEAGTLWDGCGAFYNSKYHECKDENPLRAAMIVFLMMNEQ